MVRREQIVDICRWVLGAVFSFSGIVKCVDPVGTSVFVEKYLATYSLDSLLGLALPIAVALAVVEFALGVMLLVRCTQRLTAIVTTLFMVAFTIITLLSATVLPIGDCGCFGDAVRLTPIETLAKNLVMLPMAVYLALHCERDSVSRRSWIVAAVALLAPLGMNLYALRHQPLVEFMPYREGVNLRIEVAREREILESQTSTYLVFRTSDGDELLFESNDTECWSRPDLEFVDTRQEALLAEALPFAEFIVTDAQGGDCTLELLENHPDATLLCIQSSDVLRGRRLEAVRALLASGEDVVVFTSDDASHIAEIVGVMPYNVDAMTLRSFIRSRVGVVCLEEGCIARKSDIRDL